MVNHVQLADELCDHINESEAYAAYSAQVARFYKKRDVWTKWIVAVAACGPFIDKLASFSTDISSWLLALIPLVAIALPILNYSKKIELGTTIHAQYIGMLPALRDLWRQVCASENAAKESIEEWHKTLGVLEEKLADIRTKKSDMPDIKELKKKAESEAKQVKLPKYLKEKDNGISSSCSGGGATVTNYHT